MDGRRDSRLSRRRDGKEMIVGSYRERPDHPQMILAVELRNALRDTFPSLFRRNFAAKEFL